MRCKLVEQLPDRLDHERLWGAIGLAAGLGILILPLDRLAVRCVFKALTGLPCMTCGMTRSLIHLRRLDFVAALSANPLITVAVVCGALYCLYAWGAVLLRTRRIRIQLTHRWELWAVRVLAVAIVLANWAYLIARER